MQGRQKWAISVLLMGLLLCSACEKAAVICEESTEATGITGKASDAQATGGSDEPDVSKDVSVICVFVCGEVCRPGVYELPADARIGDAIEAAGGMTEDAAQTWLNLAEHVSDGQKIEVLSVQAAEEQEEASRQQKAGLVNLNQASREELMTLTGIGEAKAKDILGYREQHGGFSSTEELMKIPGIKAGVFEKIKDQITI